MFSPLNPILHTIRMEGAADFNLPFPFQHQFISRTLHKPGVIDMKCNAGHIWMNGVVLVVRHPYYSVTDEHGDFLLTDVPPGKCQIAAFQLARSKPRHLVPQPRVSSAPLREGLDGVIDSLLAAQHVLEMFRRTLLKDATRIRLNRLSNRLTKILIEARKFATP